MKKMFTKFYNFLLSWGEVLYEHRKANGTKNYY
jgi:hypothetical protein